MFCSECGTKNEKGSKFCEKCGAKLEVEEAPKEKKTTAKSKTKEEAKPVEKETLKEETKKEEPVKVSPAKKKGLSPLVKWIIIGSSALVAIIVAFVIFASIVTKPAHIAENFMKAYANEDYRELYDYMVDVKDGDMTFVSEDAFANIMKKSNTKKIENYTVGDTKYTLGNLVATVPVSYTYEGGKSAQEMTLTFTKSSGHKYLFFADWKLSLSVLSSASTAKNYTVKVPKGAKLEFAGISVDKSYLDKSESSSSLDVYKLNQVLKLSTPIKATLDNGIVIEEKVTPYSNGSTTLRLSSYNISEKLKEELQNQGKKDLNAWYSAMAEGKEFKTLDSKTFNEKLSTTFDKDAAYIQTETKKLTKFNITKSEFSSLSSTDEGYLKVSLKIYYDYTVSYKDGEEFKTKDKSTYDYVYLTYDISGKTNKLMEVGSLPTYFSKY